MCECVLGARTHGAEALSSDLSFSPLLPSSLARLLVCECVFVSERMCVSVCVRGCTRLRRLLLVCFSCRALVLKSFAALPLPPSLSQIPPEPTESLSSLPLFISSSSFLFACRERERERETEVRDCD